MSSIIKCTCSQFLSLEYPEGSSVVSRLHALPWSHPGNCLLPLWWGPIFVSQATQCTTSTWSSLFRVISKLLSVKRPDRWTAALRYTYLFRTVVFWESFDPWKCSQSNYIGRGLHCCYSGSRWWWVQSLFWSKIFVSGLQLTTSLLSTNSYSSFSSPFYRIVLSFL